MKFYLIQRGQRPEKTRDMPKNLFGYYCGDKKFTDWSDIKKLTDFRGGLDYMGSAEFEFGEVPKAIRKIAEDFSKYKLFEIIVTGFPYTSSYNFTHRQKDQKSRSVYVFCMPEQLDEITNFIQGEASRKGKHRLKERSFIQEGCFGTLGNQKILKSDTSWWLDIENHWLAGVDENHISNFIKMLSPENLEK